MGEPRTNVERAKRPNADEVRRIFAELGQEHVFRFWDGLDTRAQERLLGQAARIADSLPALMEDRVRALGSLEGPPGRAISPCPAISLPEHGGDETTFNEASTRGLDLLHDGRVACLVVAGGQGSRLGFDGPKGAYPVGPITQRSLFAIQAQKLRALARRTGQVMHWFVMTSPATDAATRALFKQEKHFGLSQDQIFIFLQNTIPAWSFDGKLILESPDQIFESPGGHGDTYTALANSGALDRMEQEGLDRVFYYQVDNPLVEMADPTFLGFHESLGAEMSCKVIRKSDPMEKVGVMATRDGQPGVVEYTELADEQRHARDERGDLLYWAGNIGIHAFNLPFLRRVAHDNKQLLPYHASPKKIPTLDENGQIAAVQEPNGPKLERFVFDALPAAQSVCVLEVSAEKEFSPVKNASGPDSPDSARAALTALYRGWLEESNLTLPEAIQAIEIDHSIADSSADLAQLGLDDWQQAGESIRIVTGTTP
ncbi:MAG: UDPGP type 1 family protein [Myxococcota bacterium]|nr:UDPGP type 1 family protein [Myxococcota bacterium]